MKNRTKLLTLILTIALTVSIFASATVAIAEEAETISFIASDTCSFVNHDAPVTLEAGEGITMEMQITSFTAQELSGFANMGFAISNGTKPRDHYDAGNQYSYIFGQQRTLGIFLSKDYGALDSASDNSAYAPLEMYGCFNWSVYMAPGNWIKVEYVSASSATEKDGYWKIYNKLDENEDYELICSVTGLSSVDAPYGDVYFGMDTQFAMSVTAKNFSCKTTVGEDVVLQAGAGCGTVLSGSGSGSGGGGSTIVDPSAIPVVSTVSEITFTGIGGKNEAVNRYAQIYLPAGMPATLTFDVMSVDNSVMSYPQFGFTVSNAEAVGQMHAAGTAGSYIYGEKGDTTVNLYAKSNGLVSSGYAPNGFNISGAFPHDEEVVAGRTIKVEYMPASSGNNGYWKIYSKATGTEEDFVLLASAEGLSAVDAPSGSIYLGIHTYRTYVLTARDVQINAVGALYALDRGDLCDVEYTNKIGDKAIITRTDMSFGEVGLDVGQTVISNKDPVVLPAGGTITMEAVILEADISALAHWGNVGFSVANAPASNGALYTQGTRGSFFFGQNGRVLGIYLDKTYGLYSTFVTDRPAAETGLAMSGTLNPKDWMVSGNTIKVEYKAASSSSAKDGYWKFSIRKPGETAYAVKYQVTGMDINSAPYGAVYFGLDAQDIIKVSFGELKVYTQDNESLTLNKIKGKNSINSYLALNGAVEAPLKTFEKKVFNSGFEITDEGALVGWNGTGTITADTANVYEGTYSGKITGAVSLVSEKVDITAGLYQIALMSNSAVPFDITATYYNDETELSSQTVTFAGNGSWVELIQNITVPANADNMKLTIVTPAGFDANIDAIHVYKATAEYSTWRVQNSANADEVLMWLKTGYGNYGNVIDANKDAYFKAIKEYAGELTTDSLADLVFEANVTDFPTEVYIDNADFSKVDAIGYPVNWIVSDTTASDDVVASNGAVAFKGTLTSRYVSVDDIAGLQNPALVVNAFSENGAELIAEVWMCDDNFGVVNVTFSNITLDGNVTKILAFNVDEGARYFKVKLYAQDSAVTVYSAGVKDQGEAEVYAAFTNMTIEDILGDNARVSEVRYDLNLNSAFTWTSSNTSFIANNGKVTRPAYGQAGQIVTLTAKAEGADWSMEKEFNFFVMPEDYDKYEAMNFFNQDANYTYCDYFGWGGYVAPNSNATLGFSSAFAFEGSALKISNAKGVADLRSYTVFDVRQNGYYRAEVLVYTDSESTAPSVGLEFLDYQNLTIATYTKTYNLGKRGTWQNVVVEGYAPKGAVSVAIRVGVPGANPDTAYFDELRIYRYEGLDNADFEFGNKAWTVTGTYEISENAITLTDGTLTSDYLAIGEGARYVAGLTTSAKVNLTIEFYNSAKSSLGYKRASNVTGDASVAELAPAGAKYARVIVATKATGTATTLSNINIETSPIGTTLYDSNFAQAGTNRPSTWTFSDGVMPFANSLTLTDGASAISSNVTIQEGKKYAVVANLVEASANAVATIEYYNYSGSLAGTSDLTANGTVLSYVFDCPLDIYYVKVKLAAVGGSAVYKDAQIYPIASSVSSASFEQVDAVVTGNMPLQWKGYGDVGIYAASRPTAEEVEIEVPDIMHMLEVVSHGATGGVESAMIEDIVGGREYTAAAYMRTSGTAKLIVKYYDANFALVTSFEESIENVTAWEKVKVNTTAPANATYATVSLEQVGKGVLYADVVELNPTIIVVGNTVQHFIDDYIIEESDNVEREFHDATMTDPVLDWTDDTDGTHGDGAYIYGTVLYDEEEEIYKMWYNPVSKGSGVRNGYATSTDGVNWTRSNLNLVNFNGSSANNLYSTSEFPSIFIDYETTDPNKRYVAFTFNELQYAHMIKYSADGIRWSDGPVFMKSGDVLTAAYDEVNDLYFALAKRGRYRRDFYTMTTGDLTNFSTGVIGNTLANPLDSVGYWNTQCYGAGLYAFGGSYVALDWLLAIPHTAGSYGPDYIGFAFTRDLEEDWTRPYGSNYIVPMTSEGGHVWKSLYSASYPIEMGDELWLYIGAWEGYHEEAGDLCGITIAKWRKDGFASMNTGATEGTILTKPMIFNGSALSVNANVKAGGSLKVELVDRDGNVYEGFSAADCDAITTDGTDIKVTWNGSNDVSSLKGKTVRARFISTNTELYSFHFEGEASTVTGTKVDIKEGYNYDVEMAENAQIKAGAESTLMDGDSISVEMKVIETITEGATVEVGVLGYDNTTITLDNASDIFTAGYTVKVEYTNVEGNASYIKVYRKETGAEAYGEAVVSETGLNSAIFARLALWSTTGLEGTVSEIKFYVNSTAISGVIADEGVKFTELAKPLEEVGTKKITADGYGIYGYNEGIDVGYGGTLTMSFDVLEYDNSGKSQIRFAVTDDPVLGAHGTYKNGYAGAVMGFTADTGAMDWYPGNASTTKNTENLLVAGYSYKLVYTATAASTKSDGTLVLYECKTSKVGTVDQNWVAVYSIDSLGNTAGGNSFSPINDVKINIYFGGNGLSMTLANVIVSSSATIQKFNQMYASDTLTVEDSDLVPDAPDSELLPEEKPDEPEQPITDPVFVTFDYNGATGFETDVIKIQRNTTVAEPDMTNVSLAGATFVKWVDSKGDDFDFTKPVTDDIVVSAIFESNYDMDMPITYIATAPQFIGINESINVGYGNSLTWQFDVLEYSNPGRQIRMTASTATAASGNTMAYKVATGESSQVMGFAHNGVDDWYGGNVTKTKTISDLFLAGYSYRLTYTAPTAEYAVDASYVLYECEIAKVGTEQETWKAVYTTAPFGNTEGGHHFAPITSVNLNLYLTADIKIGMMNHKLFLGTTEQVFDLYMSDGFDWDYAPYAPAEDEGGEEGEELNAEKITITSAGLVGNTDGFDIGYGGSIAWQFDINSITYSSTVWYFGVTDYPASSIQSAPGMISCYKWGYKGERLGFYTAKDMDWFGGTSHGTTRQSNSTFVAGNTYKFVYTAATSDTGADGSAILYECATSKVGTEEEVWTEILYVKGVDNSANTFMPTADISIGLYMKGTLEMVIQNSTIVAKDSTGATIAETVANVFAGDAVSEDVFVADPEEEPEENEGAPVYVSTGYQFVGINENVNVGLGGTIYWQFDVHEYVNEGIGIRMVAGSATAASGNAMAYKPATGESSQIMGFTYAGGDDWYSGNVTKTKTMSDLFLAGYSYRISYTAPTAEYAEDGIFVLYECETAKVGTNEEAWTAVYTTSPVKNVEGGNRFAPITSVNLNVYFGGAGIRFSISNSTLVVNGTPHDATLYVSDGVTIE